MNSIKELKNKKKNRATRNAARNKLMKNGRVSKGDGKDVDQLPPYLKVGLMRMIT